MLTKSKITEMVGGRFFRVTFVKKDGSIRRMVCRIGVAKYVKGTGHEAPDNIVTVYDMQAKGYRAFDVNRVHNIRQGDKVLYGDMASPLAELGV